MDKKEFMRKAIKEIRLDIRTMKRFADKGDYEMYGHMFTVINAKVSFLFATEMITRNQFFMLSRIINK